jgi:hypothetical protein
MKTENYYKILDRAVRIIRTTPEFRYVYVNIISKDFGVNKSEVRADIAATI